MKKTLKFTNIIGANKIIVKRDNLVADTFMESLVNVNYEIAKSLVLTIVKEGLVEGGKWTKIEEITKTTVEVISTLGKDFLSKTVENTTIFEANADALLMKKNSQDTMETFNVDIDLVDDKYICSYNLKDTADNTLVWITVCIVSELSTIGINKLIDEIINELTADTLMQASINRFCSFEIKQDKFIESIEQYLGDAASVICLIKNYVADRKTRYSLYENNDTDKVSAYLCKSNINGMYFVIWYAQGIDEVIRETKIFSGSEIVNHIKDCSRDITTEITSFKEFFQGIINELHEALLLDKSILGDIDIVVNTNEIEIYSYDVSIGNILILSEEISLLKLDFNYVTTAILTALNTKIE